MTLQVTSSAFSNGGTIPTVYTCDGQDVAPPLEWSGEPKQTRSFAVICEDPDAPSGTFTHWVLYDVPASAHGVGDHASIGKAGVNDFGAGGSAAHALRNETVRITTIFTCTRWISTRSDPWDSRSATR